VGWDEWHQNEGSVLAVWRISSSTLIVLSSDFKDLELNGVKTTVCFYPYHSGRNGGLLEYLDDSRI